MDMLSLGWAFLMREWSVIRKFPLTFIVAVLGLSIISWMIIYGEFRTHLELKNDLIATYEKKVHLSELKTTIASTKTPADLQEKASKDPLKAVTGKSFMHEEIPLDGYSYDKCTFDHVKFHYNGGPFSIRL